MIGSDCSEHCGPTAGQQRRKPSTFDVSVPDGVAAGETKVVVTDASGRVGEATIDGDQGCLSTLTRRRALSVPTVTVSGVGFPANDLVLIKYNDNTITTANTDSTGTFSKGIVVPSSGIATGGSYPSDRGIARSTTVAESAPPRRTRPPSRL